MVKQPEPPAVELGDEASLLRSLAQGDRSAAEILVDATYRRVFGLLCHLAGGNADLAADLTQETYRRAWAALASFDGRARFSTWLYRIATNVFLNHVRRPHLVVALEEEQGMAVPDTEPRQDDRAIAVQTQERLRRAVLRLPEELRFAVVARFWGEDSVSDIARAEAVSEVAIRKRLRRAFVLLARALEEVVQ